MRISRLGLAEEIAAQLRDQVLEGSLAPGARLTEQGVAADMGTSPGPVREAFATLRREGMIRTLPNRATYVTGVSPEEVEMVYGLRRALEPAALLKTTAAITDENIVELETVIDEMRAAVSARSWTDLVRADLAFHTHLVDLSNIQVASQVWAVIRSTLLRHFAVSASRVEPNWDTIVENHQRILNLVKDRDAGAAISEIAQHIELVGPQRDDSSPVIADACVLGSSSA